MESEVASSFHEGFWHHSYSQSPSRTMHAYRFGSKRCAAGWTVVRRRARLVGKVHVQH